MSASREFLNLFPLPVRLQDLRRVERLLPVVAGQDRGELGQLGGSAAAGQHSPAPQHLRHPAPGGERGPLQALLRPGRPDHQSVRPVHLQRGEGAQGRVHLHQGREAGGGVLRAVRGGDLLGGGGGPVRQPGQPGGWDGEDVRGSCSVRL